jgi:hypothetical protein
MKIGHDLFGRRRNNMFTDGAPLRTALVPIMPKDPREQVLNLRNRGYSVRKIEYLTGIPRATIGDWIKAGRGDGS